MSKIIEFPQTSELDKQFMDIETQQKIKWSSKGNPIYINSKI